MRIFLLSAQKDTEVLGLKSIQYYLRREGHDVSILFLPRLQLETPAQQRDVRELLAREEPKLFGMSLMSGEYDKAKVLTAFLKREFPQVPLIWGGIHPTIAPEESLAHADYVCIGEGELMMADLAACLERGEDPRQINNLAYIQDGQVIRNPLHPLMAELDRFPPYEHVAAHSWLQHKGRVRSLDTALNQRYAPYLGRTYSVLTSRGCPFHCTYCCNNFLQELYDDRKIRRRSIDHVIQELEQARRSHPELQLVNFQDDCFLAVNAKQLRAFFQEYNRRVGLPFVCHSIPTYLTEEKVALLRESRVAWVIMGLQSGSDRVLREVYRRKSYSDHFLKAAHLLSRHGVAGIYDVILDNPLETEEETLDTIATFMATPKPFMPEFFSLSLYQGTEIHRLAREAGKAQDVEDYRRKNYLVYGKSDLNRMMRLSAFLDRSLLEPLVARYQRGRRSLAFRIHLFLAQLASSFFFEPLTYFRVIRLSQGGSYLRMAQTIPLYLKEGGKRFLDQF
ncbi:MAG: cobalamin-dependent protein [Magnetococcales bacterium]|nr:cobalamin-dependent protein [Magnetococcales bacterium]